MTLPSETGVSRPVYFISGAALTLVAAVAITLAIALRPDTAHR
jgi:hypothetical protein